MWLLLGDLALVQSIFSLDSGVAARRHQSTHSLANTHLHSDELQWRTFIKSEEGLCSLVDPERIAGLFSVVAPGSFITMIYFLNSCSQDLFLHQKTSQQFQRNRLRTGKIIDFREDFKEVFKPASVSGLSRASREMSYPLNQHLFLYSSFWMFSVRQPFRTHAVAEAVSSSLELH